MEVEVKDDRSEDQTNAPKIALTSLRLHVTEHYIIQRKAPKAQDLNREAEKVFSQEQIT